MVGRANMRIAYVTGEYPPSPHGGIGTFVQLIAHGMANAGHDVTVVEVGSRHSTEYEDNVKVVRIHKGVLPLLRTIKGRWKLFRWLSEEARTRGLDIIELPEFGGLLPVAFPYCQVVVRLHQSATALARLDGRSSFGVRSLEKRTLKCHRNWIAVSDFALKTCTEVFQIKPTHYVRIYSPVVESPCEDPPPLPTRFVMFAGRISRSKGAYLLAIAAKRLLTQFTDLHLVYVGQPVHEEGRDADKSILSMLGGLSSRVHFLGRLSRADVLSVMRRASVFVLPSYLENFPLVVAEAMLSGCPTVVPDTPPFNEYLESGSTSVLVTPDDATALAAGIASLLGNPEMRFAIANAGKHFIERHCSLSISVDKTLRFYADCISRT
jgi:glycosyltransferase involved in cell wall biosynthesis